MTSLISGLNHNVAAIRQQDFTRVLGFTSQFLSFIFWHKNQPLGGFTNKVLPVHSPQKKSTGYQKCTNNTSDSYLIHFPTPSPNSGPTSSQKPRPGQTCLRIPACRRLSTAYIHPSRVHSHLAG